MDRSEPPRQKTTYRYRFGTAEFDEAAAELRIGGVPIELQRKPLEVLGVLLRRRGEVVTKDDLLASVWPGMTTVENVVANAVAKLRHALGEANAAWIITQPRIGYRFTGPVERVAAGRRLLSAMRLEPGMPVPGRDNFTLDKLIGRSLGSEVWTARQARTAEVRVYKFSPDGSFLSALKREATVSRVLRASLGARDDIVRVFDWNFETPPFFLECEYGGQDLAEWSQADNRLARMPLSQRLGIFLQVVDAVAAAHSVGVLHKDLKPANVLVAAGSGRWQIRLTDFGSARLLESDILERLGITQAATLGEVEAEAIGTPLYLAPELIAGEAATTRSDVYALGVILFQLAVGDVRRPLISSWQRDVPDLLLREDIAEATDGEPARRLDSAAELARRLRALEDRHRERQLRLDAEAAARTAVEAVARNRARRPWMLATMAGLALGILVSLTLYLQVRRTAQRLAADVQMSRTLTRFLTDDLIAAADPETTGRADVTVAAAVTAAASKVDTAFGSEAPEVRAALHGEMQKAFMGLTEYARAESEGERAIAALRAEPHPDAYQLADLELNTADELEDLGRLPQAGRLLDEVAALRGPAIAGSDVAPRLWRERGFLAAAGLDVATYLRDMQMASLEAAQVSALSQSWRNHLTFELADAYRMSGRLAEAETMFRALAGKERSLYGAADARPNFVSAALANVLDFENRPGEALGLLRAAVPAIERALGPDARRTAEAKASMAKVLYDQGDMDAAIAIWASVAASYARRQGEGSVDYLDTQASIGMATLRRGQAASAVQVLRRTLDQARNALPPNSPEIQILRYYLAYGLLTLRQAGEVPALLDGLDPDQLRMADFGPDWRLRLTCAAGWLALERGDRRGAALRFTEIAGRLRSANDPFVTPAPAASLQQRAAAIDVPR